MLLFYKNESPRKLAVRCCSVDFGIQQNSLFHDLEKFLNTGYFVDVYI